MDVSVAICTWNRADLLDATLAAMEKLRVPPGVDWELLVVNNNCEDHTDEVIARRATGLPIRRLFERQQGLSHARNCALEAARGALILWTDDDALVDPDWLVAYEYAARKHLDATFFGGPVTPWFASDPPAWLERNLAVFAGAFAVREVDATGPIRGKDDLPFGANIAIRKSGLAEVRFDPRLGRRGSHLISGEEIDLFERLLDAGHSGVWVRDARVRHWIPPNRLTRRFLWDYYHAKGRTRVRTTPDFSDERRRLVRKYWKKRIQAWRHAPRRGEKWARALKGCATTKGVIDELRCSPRIGT